VLPLVVPMLFVMAVTMFSLAVHLIEFASAKQWLLVSLTVVLSSLILWMSVESLGLFVGLVRERKRADKAAGPTKPAPFT
jgi:carbon starvation protein